MMCFKRIPCWWFICIEHWSLLLFFSVKKSEVEASEAHFRTRTWRRETCSLPTLSECMSYLSGLLHIFEYFTGLFSRSRIKKRLEDRKSKPFFLFLLGNARLPLRWGIFCRRKAVYSTNSPNAQHSLFFFLSRPSWKPVIVAEIEI